MNKIPYIAVVFLLTNAVADTKFDDNVARYDRHIDQIKLLKENVELYKLKSEVQKLKTTLEKDRIECQILGGCKNKPDGTAPLVTTSSKKEESAARFTNDQLPIIVSIKNNQVRFKDSPKFYKKGEHLTGLGLWIVEEVNATSVQLRHEDGGSPDTMYFYWQ